MPNKLPPIKLRGDFFLPMKFYWARENQKASGKVQMFTGGIYTSIPSANGMHPLFVDYDWVNLQQVKKRVKFLQEKWKNRVS